MRFIPPSQGKCSKPSECQVQPPQPNTRQAAVHLPQSQIIKQRRQPAPIHSPQANQASSSPPAFTRLTKSISQAAQEPHSHNQTSRASRQPGREGKTSPGAPSPPASQEAAREARGPGGDEAQGRQARSKGAEAREPGAKKKGEGRKARAAAATALNHRRPPGPHWIGKEEEGSTNSIGAATFSPIFQSQQR